jgi:hypothetical protein
MQRRYALAKSREASHTSLKNLQGAKDVSGEVPTIVRKPEPVALLEAVLTPNPKAIREGFYFR